MITRRNLLIQGTGERDEADWAIHFQSDHRKCEKLERCNQGSHRKLAYLRARFFSPSRPINHRLVVALLYSCLVLLTCPLDAAPDEALSAPAIAGGLAIHVGSTDGLLETALTNFGRVLVHGLALSNETRDAARMTIASHGIYGLASVATWHDRRRLPYASNLANLLVADLDAMGKAAPTSDELERVVAPDGVLLLRRDGKWTRHTKTRPDEMDDWGHFDHSASGDGTSLDKLVNPVRQQQWVTSLQAIPDTGNPAGYEPGAGVRISGRYLVMEANERALSDKKSRGGRWALHARDAFNGVPLWTLPRESGMAHGRWALVAVDGVVYTWLTKAGDLQAIDIATGRILGTFAGTSIDKVGAHSEEACVRVEGEHMIVGVRERLLCFNTKDRTERWSFARAGNHTLAPVLDADRGRVYCLVSGPPVREGRAFRGRWPVSSTVKSVVALDLADGSVVWECEEIASVPVSKEKNGDPVMRNIGQLIPADEHLIAFGSKAISGGRAPFLGAIELATGKLANWSDEPFKSNYNIAGYNLIWRDGAAWFAGAFTNLWRYDPKSGQVERKLTMSWNQRCTRFAATPRWFMFGQAAYFDRDFGGEQVSVGRSGCALPNTPANGMTYFTPTACRCTTLVRGFQAMTGELPPIALPEGKRLVTRSAPPVIFDIDGALPDGLVAADWLKQQDVGARETAKIRFGELELTSIVQQHRIEARRDDKAVWNFVTGARISSPPVISGELAIFGSHDGWVYAVDRNGRLRWKYLVAPSARLICVNAQLENCWPVYGVTLFNGKVIASAGTHVELGGGVTVVALDPASGKPAWTKHLLKQPSLVPPGGKGAKVVSRSFMNSVPRIEDGQIVLGDGGPFRGEFKFAPGDSEAELNQRLNSLPPKQKR